MKKILLSFSLFALVFCWACSSDTPKKVSSETAKAKTVSTDKKDKKTVKTEEPPQVEPVPPEQIEKAKEIIAGVSDEDVAAVDAKAKFNMLCSICHGTNGKMKIGGAKDLSKSIISLEESIAQIYHGRGTMTPYKGLLKDAEIVAVAKYIEEVLRE